MNQPSTTHQSPTHQTTRQNHPHFKVPPKKKKISNPNTCHAATTVTPSQTLHQQTTKPLPTCSKYFHQITPPESTQNRHDSAPYRYHSSHSLTSHHHLQPKAPICLEPSPNQRSRCRVNHRRPTSTVLTTPSHGPRDQRLARLHSPPVPIATLHCH